MTTPELRAEAIEVAKRFRMGPLFTPPSLADASDGTGGAFSVPGAWGGANIPGGASFDPETGMFYVATVRGASVYAMVPGEAQGSNAGYVSKSGAGARVQRLPILKPPWSSIVDIDMNTGEHLWWIPVGDTPQRYLDHPMLEGVELPESTGTGRQAAQIVTPNLLIYSGAASDGTGMLYAVDKATGERLGAVELPVSVRYGIMTYMHEGQQHIVVQATNNLTALKLR